MELEDAACGLMETTDDGTFLRANRTFCLWLGYTPEELTRRKKLQELLTMGGRIFHQTHWAPLLQIQGSISEVKLELVHRDGSTIPMVLNAVRRERDGAYVHDLAAFVARDRDKYERELVLSRKKLEELVAETTRLHAEAKDRAVFSEQMIGIVSHDLRNPLSTVGLGISLLAADNLSSTQQRTLDRIRRSTERANRLVADLLDFTQARLGSGLSVMRDPIDVHEVMSNAVDELAVTYPARAIRHEQTGEGTCSGDANRLAQLVGNLVSNAVTYGRPETPVVVTSSIEPTTFAIAVHNDGDPIPQAAQATLFEPMTRGTSAGSAARSVGLGLYIVSEIARAHGGRASVESSAERGTTFKAVFPRS